MHLSYRWAEKKDTASIKLFMAEQYGAGSIQAAPGRFEALFLDHPQGFHIALCTSNDEIVGLRCYMPVQISCYKQLHNAAFPVDMMVKPALRRHGIGSKFLLMAQDRFAFTLSSGQSEAQASLYKKKGAVVVAAYNIGYLVRRPNLRTFSKTTVRDVLSWLHWSTTPKRPANMKEISVTSASVQTHLSRSRFSQDEAGSALDQATFRWRYDNSFYNDYSVVQIESGGTQGILTCQTRGEETRIIDIFCPAQARITLLNAAATVLPGRRISAFFAGVHLAQAYRRAGFLVRPRDTQAILFSQDCHLLDQLSRASWILFGGDSDTKLRELPCRLQK